MTANDPPTSGSTPTGSDSQSDRGRGIRHRLHLGPSVQAELDHLERSSSEIVRALADDPDLRRLFVTDPVDALRKIGVEVPPILKQHMKSQPALSDLTQCHALRLPNGQVVVPEVTINFTPGRHV